jgi:hypothetical protein
MRLRMSLLVIVVALLLGAPAAAGVILHVVESSDAVNRHSHTEMDVSAEGGGLRADVTVSDDPFNPVGNYILFPDDQTFVLVNPARKTYTTMDLSAMAGMMQQVQRMQQQASGSSAPAAPEKVVVEKKLDEAGPVMLGLPTQHVVYEVSYHMPPPSPNAPVFDYREKYELWATKALDTRLVTAPVLKSTGSRLSNLGGGGAGGEPKEVADQLTPAIQSHGFILKENFTKEGKMTLGPLTPTMGATMFMRGRGQGQQSSTSFVVTAIRDESLEAERFVLPKGYTETEMMNPNMGAMPDLSKLPGKPDGAAPPGNSPQQMPDLNNIPK